MSGQPPEQRHTTPVADLLPPDQPAAAETITGPVPPPPQRRPWRLALLLPLVLALPWLLLTRPALPPILASVNGMCLCLLVVTVTVTDLLWHRIFNWTTYTVVLYVAGLQLAKLVLPSGLEVVDPASWLSGPGRPVALATLLGGPEPLDALLGLSLGFGLMFFLYSVFGGGAGDLKLVTALGALLGPTVLIESLIYGYILAGVVVGCYLTWVIGPWGMLVSLIDLLGLLPSGWLADPAWRAQLRRKIPLGPYLSVGALLAVGLPGLLSG
jgi:Flp pilus assembly protein protease CpaA